MVLGDLNFAALDLDISYNGNISINADLINQDTINKIVSEFRDDSFNTFGGSSNLNDNLNLSNNLNLSSRNLNSNNEISNDLNNSLNSNDNLNLSDELNSTQSSKEYEFISQNQINKIIEELNIYTNSSIDTNFNFTEFNNDKFIQIYT